ncbi:MAG: hypothetical protein MUC49_16550 [Raineya sp.]|jgi:hypothetical protein|nr:hypothetical protein [Raineya sp.]
MEYNQNQESHALRVKELETIIKICDELKSLNSDINPFIYFRKAQALLALGKEEEGLRVLNIAQDIFEENYGTLEDSYSWSKEVNELYLNILIEQAKRQVKNPSKALWLYNEAYQLTKEPELRYEFKQMRQSAYQDLINSPITLKRFAYIEDELPSTEPLSILPLLSSDTGNIKLVGNTAKKGSFWIAHPYKKRIYYDFEQANQLAFNDYVNEFVQLVQHLGASKITLEYINERQNEGKNDPAAEKLPDDVSNQVSRKASSTIITHTFNPRQKAHVPTHLAWYASQQEWQALVVQRSQGSITEINITLNSANILRIHESDLEEVQEELRELLDNNYKSGKTESSNVRQKRRVRKTGKQEHHDFSLHKDWKYIECNIKVEFAPLDQLKSEIVATELEIISLDLPEPSVENRKMASVDVSSMIQEVVEKIKPTTPKTEVKEKVVEPQETKAQDPVVKKKPQQFYPSDEEETAYDKWKKLIQEERRIAKELLEEQAKNPDVEKTLDKIITVEPKRERDDILDPDITEEEKKKPETIILEKKEPLKETISSEDTRDQDGLTADERYYYEMLQHAYQDGNISEDVRKVLERRRQRYKISEQRAKEIEKMMLDKK